MHNLLLSTWLKVVLPVGFGLAALLSLLALDYGLGLSLLVSVLAAALARGDGAARARSLRDAEGARSSLHVVACTAILYAMVLAAGVGADVVSTRMQFFVPWLLAPMAAAAAYALGSAILFGRTDPFRVEFRRGRKLISYADAVRRAATLVPATDSGIYWGGLRMPSNAAVTHFCVAGATGSGKTVTLRLLMQSVLPAVGVQKDTRALVYDAKQDVVSLLHGMGLSCDVRILNPFDTRSWAWDMARDVTSPATATQIASILIAKEDGANRFFSDAAQHLLAGVLITLIRSGKPWTFRDALLITGDPVRLRSALERDPYVRGLIQKYFNDERLLSNILSTLASKTMLYEPVAAVWEQAAKAGRILSLQDWVAGSFILVLGNDETIRAPMDAINKVLFQRASELLLAGTESASRRTWIFLDELAKAGKLEGLDSLLTKGRSKGVCVVLGFQDIDSLRDPHLYGEKVAHVLVGMCANKAVLRLDSEPTAKWASGLIGEFEAREYNRSETTGGSGKPSETMSAQIVKREAVLASELLSLSHPDRTGLRGYYIVPPLGVYSATFDFRPLLKDRAGVPDFVPRPVEEQYLSPWSVADEKRLGLSDDDAPPAGPASSPKPQPTPLDDIPRMVREEPGA